MPTGQLDPYIMFCVGRAGRPGAGDRRAVDAHPESDRGVHARAVAGLRLRRLVAMEVLDGGNVGDKQVLWGDTHHPGLSETAGDYDGQFLFINDKANARVAVIDLRDFETKQIVKNPNAINDHGGAFVTPNTEYVIEGPQYAAPIGCEYAPIEEYKEKYRGLITFWEFDRARAASTRPSRSRSSCRRTGRTCATPARRSATAGCSATRSTPRWRPAASERATRRSRPARQERHGLPAHLQLEEGRGGRSKPARPSRSTASA